MRRAFAGCAAGSCVGEKGDGGDSVRPPGFSPAENEASDFVVIEARDGVAKCKIGVARCKAGKEVSNGVFSKVAGVRGADVGLDVGDEHRIKSLDHVDDVGHDRDKRCGVALDAIGNVSPKSNSNKCLAVGGDMQ